MSDLKPPYDVTARPAPEGGWRVIVEWEYDFRDEEVDRFVVSRKRRDEENWQIVANDIPHDERFYVDVLPDEKEYTYSVSAVSAEGGNEFKAFQGFTEDSFTESAYVAASPDATKPQGIRKPLKSTKEVVFITWDIQPQASGYLLEALGPDGTPYMSTTIDNPETPVGVLVGPHPGRTFVARVSVLRPRLDHSLYIAASSVEAFEVDNASNPHLGMVEFEHDPDTGVSYGAVLALAGPGRSRDPLLCVAGSPQIRPWTYVNGHAWAMVMYAAQGRSNVIASLAAQQD